ncbi:MAG: hypothetical protein DDT26_00103 [Dehalococcoidia bacterium]|nr:hypothetical protein [Chloroflexota bacterium]
MSQNLKPVPKMVAAGQGGIAGAAAAALVVWVLEQRGFVIPEDTTVALATLFGGAFATLAAFVSGWLKEDKRGITN